MNKEQKLMTRKQARELERMAENAREKSAGILPKYVVWRVDGGNKRGRKHNGCDYFVLDWNHDRYAIPAMTAYAKACRRQYPVLAKDIMKRVKLFGGSHA